MKKTRIGIIGGTRGMGRWFAHFLKKQDFDVAVCDEKTKLTPIKLAAASDVVVVSVPIGLTVDIIAQIGPLVKEDGLLMDLTSLKVLPVEAMLRHSRAEVIGCHPLFGPQVRSLHGRKVVLCPARPRRRLPWLTGVFQKAGALVVETTPAEHDRRMALVQGLNHLNSLLMGMALCAAGADPAELQPFSTPAFQEKMKLVKKVLLPQARLSAEIMTMNRNMPEIVALYEQNLAELKKLLPDKKGLIARMEHHANTLWPD